MDLTLLHPKLVHIPIALAVLMPLFVGGFWLLSATDVFRKRIWWVAFALQLILVGSSFAAMETGEIDEERAEMVVPESAIEAHEEAAEVFTWATVGLLPLLLALGVFERRGAQHLLAATALVASSAILFLGYRVGDAGGAIVYEHGLSKVGNPAGETVNSTPQHEYDDDD